MSRFRIRRAVGYLLATLLGTCPLIAAGGAPYRWPDYDRLITLADSAAIDRRVVLAIAWEETADNTDPRVRGHHCWYSYRSFVPNPVTGGTDTVRVTHHEADCEVGRYQIKPSTARFRCRDLNVFTYDGNLACFARMFAQDAAKGGNLYAITRHNGAGPRAAQYLDRVLTTIGWLVESQTG